MLEAAEAERRAVNPARAGMIRTTASAQIWSRRKPRASGDDPLQASWDRAIIG